MLNRTINVERLPFFWGIARILSDIECKPFLCKQIVVTSDDYEITSEPSEVNVDINVVEIISPENEVLLHYESLCKPHDITLESIEMNQLSYDEFISLHHALNVTKDLRLSYPHLNDFMKLLKQVAIENEGKLITKDIENIVDNYYNDISIESVKKESNNNKILYLHNNK